MSCNMVCNMCREKTAISGKRKAERGRERSGPKAAMCIGGLRA